jgi:hypothetical protein
MPILRTRDGGQSAPKKIDGLLGVCRPSRVCFVTSLVTDEKGDRVDGREAIRDTHASWALDMQRMLGRKGEALHPTFNITFSIPAHTEADRILDAVQAFAREYL